MSKLIKITQESIDAIVDDFKKTLEKLKMSDGKVSYTKNFGTVDRKATLYFTELAYMKMMMLVREFDTEVAWHGLAYRGDDPEKDEYIIRDIQVYPQVVTGAHVDTDQEEYSNWLYECDDDVFHNRRMQGHSHVNMGVSPSSTDLADQEKILEQLNDTMFYIFLIWNKKGDRTIRIFDLAKNILFETADVTVATIDDGLGLAEFLGDAKSKVKKQTYAQTTKPTTTTAPAKKDDSEKEEAKKKFDTTTKRTGFLGRSYGNIDDDWYDYSYYGKYNRSYY